MDNQVMMRIVHRIFYVSVGRARLEKAQEIINMVKDSIKESDANKGVPENTFLDIFIPQWGDVSPRVEMREIEIPHTQFGKLPTNILEEISIEQSS